MCTLVYLDHTVVLGQLDVQSRKGLNCYALLVNLLSRTYSELSRDFRGLADTISSQIDTGADVWCCLIPRYVTAVPWPTTLQITLWIKRKSLFWTSHFNTRNSQYTGNYWRIQYSHQVAWQIHSSWPLTWPMFSWSLEISMQYSSVLMTICWIIWTTDMWPLMTVIETRTFLSTQWWPLRYFACSCSAIFPRIPEQRVDRTRPQSGCSVYQYLLQVGHMDSTMLVWWKTTGREAFFLIFFLYLPCWKLGVKYL